MYATNAVFLFEYIPRILFELLVAEAQTAAVLVNFENNNVHFSTELCEFRGVFNLLGPAEVRDVNETVNTFFKLNEYAEVCEVANLTSVLTANGEFLFDVLPRIVFKLLDTERHLAFLAVECEDNSVNLITNFEEFLCAAQVLAPRHFANVDKAFNTRSNLNESTVVCHNDNLTVNLVTNLEVCIKSIPRMRSELLQTECDTLLLFIEVENYNVQLLVEFNNLVWIVYAAPRPSTPPKSMNTP